MRTLKLLSIALVGAGLLAACGDDTGTSTTSSTSTGGGGTGGSTTTSTGGGGGGTGGGLTIPELGPQIDRMGRPAINTALNDTFLLAAGGVSNDAARGASEDAYNENGAENTWVATHGPSAALQLGVLDVLDAGLNGTTNEQACENGLLSCGDISNTAGTCYQTLANILMKDRIWVRSDGDNCTATEPADPDGEGYLAVELNALGFGNADCGGRRPADDVIKKTYSAVALGAPAGFDDGITQPANLHPESFPYLAAPH